MENEISERLFNKELKITPQQIALLKADSELEVNSTAVRIIDFIKQKHPNIATKTVCKTLETFVENEIIKSVKTEKSEIDSLIFFNHLKF